MATSNGSHLNSWTSCALIVPPRPDRIRYPKRARGADTTTRLTRPALFGHGVAVLQITDEGRIRLLTLDRPEALNAFNDALYDATTDALIDAAGDRQIAVLLVTGTGRSFSAGTDVLEMAARATGGGATPHHGFPGLVDQLATFPKPLICAV